MATVNITAMLCELRLAFMKAEPSDSPINCSCVNAT